MTILPQPSAFSLAAARLGWAAADCIAPMIVTPLSATKPG
jgi:precorrin-6B methylase 1